jgi:hypothetical protein
LPKHEIDAYLRSSDSKKTSGSLYQAYKTAANPKEWIAEQDEIREILAKAPGSEDEAAEDEDELAEEGEEPAAKAGNKRKRPTAEVKKPTKKETASKKAKTEKAPAKKVRDFRGACANSQNPWLIIFRL